MKASTLRQYAADPLDFIEDLLIPSAHGNQRFAEVIAPYQYQWFEEIAPSLVAVAQGKQPECGHFWVERTKGGSKDSDVALCLLWLLAFSQRPLDMQVGAADRDQANEVRKAARDVLQLNPWLGKRVQSQNWSLVCRATHCECNILASDVAGSHGARPDILFINELSHVEKQEFAENLMDNATKKPNGLVIVATNSGFKGSWQESWRNMARESSRWNFHYLGQPAPWLSEEEVEEARRRNSKARFRRLFLGEWVAQVGDALDDDDIQACIDENLMPGTKQSGWFYVAGLDLGVKHDHSALVVIGGNRESQELQVVQADAWAPSQLTGKIDLMKVEQHILAADARYDFLSVGFDPYQAELMSQRLEASRVRMQEVAFQGKNLNLMATTMLEVFRERRLRLFPCKPLIADLSRLTIEEKSYGHRLTATRNDQGHADLATALAIALMLAVEQSGQKKVVATVLDCHSGQHPGDRTARQMMNRWSWLRGIHPTEGVPFS